MAAHKSRSEKGSCWVSGVRSQGLGAFQSPGETKPLTAARAEDSQRTRREKLLTAKIAKVAPKDAKGTLLRTTLMDYLLKSEASVYSFADLLRDKTTIWDGVTNPVAVKNLRGMKAGDRLVIYHTGDEKSAVGTASVVSVDVADPKVPQVRIKAGAAIGSPKTLADIKASKVFADSPLVHQGRLSVVPLTAAQYKFLTGE
jgi:predicted RNA-binding protein with PUA-like domain